VAFAPIFEVCRGSQEFAGAGKDRDYMLTTAAVLSTFGVQHAAAPVTERSAEGHRYQMAAT
jgi:hypothetical protein